MHLTLHLPPETEARLIEQAALDGKRPEDFALEALLDKLSLEPAPMPSISVEEWLERFDAWVAQQESRNPQLDDSRESFYPDRW